MFVRSLDEIIGTDREVDGGNWVSRRLVLKDDGMGYSVHDTIIKEGTETHIHYKNHLESVYLIEGEGEVETVADGKVWPVKAGEIYVLDKNDEHYLRANKGTHMRMVCVFNPPISGREVHDEDGVYPVDND
ncbi:ectoine synthase [Natronospira bacteriovora]|uniref:L-ectoine synthase n=1 Tax=Natronospira bacteriovora TaxID=3069753 RepID=A0ABU0W958_9GAMM|nr:ectoine synthase [Natronospira sp. AB-CW4]MDQ2070563.1 ectoine synthase [Natronospira sp. AB-CW4]